MLGALIATALPLFAAVTGTLLILIALNIVPFVRL
ncbi:hypothetical protein EV589_1074 [Mycobacterium sp. BK558]|nr:hypothetical protein EV589_1074 [Mycobacterium sp. BK558]